MSTWCSAPADLRIEVTTSDGKVYNAHYITGDPQKRSRVYIKIDGQSGFPFINLDNPSPNLLGQTVIVLGNSVGYGSSISRGRAQWTEARYHE